MVYVEKNFKESLLLCLHDLASLEMQEKYIVNATKEKFLRVDECLILPLECCRQMDETDFNAEQLALAKELADKIDNMDWCKVHTQPAEELIYRNEEWIDVRNTALRLINLFGYTLDDFHEDEDGFVVPPQK